MHDLPGGAIFKSIHDLARRLKRTFEEHSSKHGLTLAQWRVIQQLATEDGTNQVALAAKMDVTPMTMSGIIERLEARGLVERVPDPADSRAKLVRSTPQSLEMAAEGFAIRNRLLEDALSGLTQSERETLDVLLQKLSNTIAAKEPDTKESA